MTEPTPPKQQQQQRNHDELIAIGPETGGCVSFDSAHETIVQVGSDIRAELSKALINNILLAMGITSVIVAWIFPEFGAVYVRPGISASWIAVIIIFFISGLSMDTATIVHAGRKIKFNTFIQLFNFVFVSAICYLFSLLMVQYEVIPNSLAKGLVICSCLPQSICSAIVLTKAAGGDPATAMINAVFSNVAGIIISPLLIFCYLGVNSHVDKSTVIPMLLLKVALPLVAGQVVHYFVTREIISAYDHPLKVIQECAMVFIIFAQFSQLFLKGTGTTLLDVAIMIVFQLVIMITSMLWVWMLLRMFFPLPKSQPKFHATGLFLSVSKTMPMGIPLINALYKGHPNLALFTLPLLVWYPLTIVMGILIAPKVSEYVQHKESALRKWQAENQQAQMMDYHQIL
jgi:sodium/bile acid cotransporter 7